MHFGLLVKKLRAVSRTRPGRLKSVCIVFGILKSFTSGMPRSTKGCLFDEAVLPGNGGNGQWGGKRKDLFQERVEGKGVVGHGHEAEVADPTIRGSVAFHGNHAVEHGKRRFHERMDIDEQGSEEGFVGPAPQMPFCLIQMRG